MSRLPPSASLASLLCVAALLAVSPAAAAPGDMSLGAKIGPNWSRLGQPDDANGAPTLMHGTAFDGFGFTVGPTYDIQLSSLGGLPLSLEGDLLYSRHVGSGFERHRQSGVERTATLKTDSLRIPALVTLGFNPQRSFYAGVGPELLVGLRSAAAVELENTDANPEPLHTTPTTHLAFNALVGAEITAGSNLEFPVEFRATWDPFVGRTTVDRFQGFQSVDEPGSYEVAFGLQFLLLTGVRWTGL